MSLHLKLIYAIDKVGITDLIGEIYLKYRVNGVVMYEKRLSEVDKLFTYHHGGIDIGFVDTDNVVLFIVGADEEIHTHDYYVKSERFKKKVTELRNKQKLKTFLDE